MYDKEKQIIHNTIRKTIYIDMSCARLIDYMVKNNCPVKGCGMLDGHMYLIFPSDTYLELLDKWRIMH